MSIEPQSLFHLSRPMTSAEMRMIRDRCGLTGGALAIMLRIGERTVRRWEMGHTEIPGPAAALLRLIK
jgi:DNA-binding transcriptional regulator YiaG